MPAYEMFAEFYDSLTDNVEYKKRADYIVNILEKKHNHNLGLTLDLACGTGTLTILLKEMGVDIYGIDASQDMLSVALQKSAEKGLNILFLCQKMQSLDLYGTIDTCLCTLDSLNHITDYETFKKAIYMVSFFMNKGGYFLFDLNTQYKHQKVLADNTFVYETEDVFCVWQNTLNKNNIVDIDLDFFVNDNELYRRFSESFKERAYSMEEVKFALESAGFALEGVYGDLSENPPVDNEERIIFIARKV
jgi:2-polyprenyl-3-methyl-5-hydroxy-6-metoxy-1,4-benzoquinol methylase